MGTAPSHPDPSSWIPDAGPSGTPGDPVPPGPPEQLSDPAQESLSSALRSGFQVLRVLMLVLLGAYLLSGWFQVEPGQQGLIVRFGRLLINRDRESPFGGTPVFGPGSHLALPDPLDEKIRIPGRSFRLPVETFLFRLTEKDRGSGRPLSEIVPNLERLEPGVDGAMISGDQNLSHGLWTVEYHIQAADAFVQTVGDAPEALTGLLTRLLENAVIRTLASRRVEEVTRTGLEAVAADVKRRLTRDLEALGSGVVVDKITAETIEPGRVRSAFLRVTEAANERQKQIESAEQTRRQKLNQAAGPQHEALLRAIAQYGAAQAARADPQRLEELRRQIDRELEHAGGEVAIQLREAQARANQIREGLRREYEEFVNYLGAYRQNPALTVVNLWTRMRRAILTNRTNEVIYLPPSGDVIEILINRDPRRLIEADIERFRRQVEGAPEERRP